MIIGRILGRVLIAAALVYAALAGWLWFAGEDLTAVAGEFWLRLDAASLTRTQAAVQRYLHPGLWDALFVPILARPAWQALGVSILALYVTGALLVRVFRGRRRDKRIFTQPRD